MSRSPTIEPENILKGRMAEALVDELLRCAGNKVYRFGYEAVLQNLTQIDPVFDRKSEVGRRISSIPDFLVLNRVSKPFFVEVKFRSQAEPYHDDLIRLLRTIDKFWKAKVILVTLQRPYLRVFNPPYFDGENNLVFKDLEDDKDLNVGKTELEEVERLIEKYFGHLF
jgi:hypothetical protein